jgi:DDE family transposase
MLPVRSPAPAPLNSRVVDRKRVEMLFAHLKRILRLGRLRLRGPSGAQFEFTLAAIAQNLRRLAKLIARPPPIAHACAA